MGVLNKLKKSASNRSCLFSPRGVDLQREIPVALARPAYMPTPSLPKVKAGGAQNSCVKPLAYVFGSETRASKVAGCLREILSRFLATVTQWYTD